MRHSTDNHDERGSSTLNLQEDPSFTSLIHHQSSFRSRPRCFEPSCHSHCTLQTALEGPSRTLICTSTPSKRRLALAALNNFKAI